MPHPEVDALLQHEASNPEVDVDLAKGILHRLLDRAERISLCSFVDRS